MLGFDAFLQTVYGGRETYPKLGDFRGKCPPKSLLGETKLSYIENTQRQVVDLKQKRCGEPYWVRTSDLLIKSQPLYQLS